MYGKASKGFTLIEMSVVLVIIGLLVSSIVVGQSMIRSSKVQSIISDVSGFQSSISQFKQKYNEIPGDMADATNYWGTNALCGSGGLGTGTQTCNGDGNRRIDISLLPNFEQFLVWQHLANAGFISGQYTGMGSPAGTPYHPYFCAPGVNCPGGRLDQLQSYYLRYSTGVGLDAIGVTTKFWLIGPAHYLIVGRTLNSNYSGYPGYPLVSAPEALTLDAKIDDGLPGMGLWRSFEATGGAGYLPNCVVTNGTTNPPPNGSIASAATAVYNTAYGSALACSFLIQINF